ncbi:MAG: SDR family oxidoreductase [Acidimicrobiales bacterium]
MTGFTAGDVALVTGGAGDIGRAVARRLVADGASVILADLPSASVALDRARAECAALLTGAATVTTTTFDVTDRDAATEAIEAAAAAVGVPNLLCNNAGYQGAFANAVDADLADAERVLAVNVIGVLNVLQVVARVLRDAGRPERSSTRHRWLGSVVRPTWRRMPPKGAVIALTRTAAKDLAPLGIRVNAVSPGFIGPGAMWDNQVRLAGRGGEHLLRRRPGRRHPADDRPDPLRRYGSLDEVAAVVRFLLSDDASYLTGQNIEIAGGAS